MDWVIVTLIVANAALFGAMAVWAARTARREMSPRLRPFGWIVAAVCGAFLLGSVQRLALQAHRVGLLPDEVGELLLADLQLAKSVLSLSLGLLGLVFVRRLTKGLRQMDRMVSVLTERVTVDASVSDLGLTPRELEVLEVVGQGVVSDQDIASALGIAPSTAKTHIRNLLRKAGVHRRQDLLGLVHADQPAKVGRR